MNKIVFKLGGSILLLFGVILFLLGFVLNHILSGLYYQDVKEEINELSSRYANAMHTIEDNDISQMFVSLAGFTNTEVFIVNNEGMIVASSNIPGIVLGEKMKRKDFALLKTGKPIENEYQFLPATERYVMSGHPIYNDDQFEGGIFVLSSVSNIDASIAQIRRLVTFAGLGAFLVAIGFTFVLSRKLSAPLIEMEKATRKISKGDLQTRVAIHSNDEVGQLANAINDLAIELERYRNNRQEFFANISHELRTPITYLEGYANVLKNKLYTTEKEKNDYLLIISDESQRLIRLINDLFDLSKAEEGELHIKNGSLHLKAIIESVVKKVTLRAKEKGLTIHKEISSSIPLIHGDEQRMEQIFINLIENALHYTEKGTIFVILQSSVDEVKVTIKDTGIGIPNEELPHIFERFHRVEKSRSRDFGGTGLGLSIVKKLVELQNGTITVSSDINKGTIFEIVFPAVQSF